MKINKISKKYFKGKVYDITVEGEHTYTINDCVVHNSACGSLTAYCLGITTIDPLRFNLIFERFISQARMPDYVYNYWADDNEV